MTDTHTPAPDHTALRLRELREWAMSPSRLALARKDWLPTLHDRLEAGPQPDISGLGIAPVIEALRKHTTDVAVRLRFQDVGTVQHVGNGVATLSGLRRVHTDDLVDFPSGVQGLVLNLDRDHVDVVLLGPDEGIRGGDLVTASGVRLRVPVGPRLIGRVLNALGEPLDARGPVDAAAYYPLERGAPTIVQRSPVEQSLLTGTKVIDALTPIGRGQRELIVGDRQTGKTTLAVDAIINQRDADVRCIYVAVGQKKSSTLAVIQTLRQAGALEYTSVVVSSSDDPPALRYLAPYTGCTIAEYAMYTARRDVLIVYDDLTKHADAYRELSLLLRRPPGREAYPGDIFYLHSRLLERAGKLNEEEGGGSLTALPIAAIQQGSIAAYIPTNLISITDGQILLDSDLFNRGIRPAVDVGRSVSRVGGAAQSKAIRELSGQLRLELAQFEEIARFARFGTEVDEATQRQIERGRRLQVALGQHPHQPLSLVAQILVLIAATEGYLDGIAVSDVESVLQHLITEVEAEHPRLWHQIDRTGELLDNARDDLTRAIEASLIAWTEGRA
ncbi:MAG: F0F1 ATP synthase subunit alpha [Anaerolineae bacterium]